MPKKSKAATRNSKIDEEVAETFPASDPPAFMAGTIGAPPRSPAKKAEPKPKKPAKKRK